MWHRQLLKKVISLTRNMLKTIACISMLIDHIGYILFPQIAVLRYIGRLAMPIFAFFIGEGCLHTRDRKKYFLRLFSLGMVCQAVYVLEYLIMGSGDPFYLNILLTFSASIVLCSTFFNCFDENGKSKKGKENYILGLVLAFFAVLCFLGEREIIPLYFDYGFGGILLPVFAATTKNKNRKFFVFSAGLILFLMLLDYSDPLWTVFALCSLIPLYFYNGKSGKRNLKLAFYLFYPLHLAVLYVISYFL